jgi:hypothetical protein
MALSMRQGDRTRATARVARTIHAFCQLLPRRMVGATLAVALARGARTFGIMRGTMLKKEDGDYVDADSYHCAWGSGHYRPGT